MGGCNSNDCSCKDLRRRMVRLEDQLAVINEGVAPLIGGHPVIVLTDTDDIGAFDTVTGWGSGIWAAYAIANGSTYTRNGNTVATFDFRDRMPVGAGTTYTEGDTGGAATHTLTVAELPVVSPSVTDPGHTHTLTDPGHTHVLTDPQHTHATTVAAHSHTGTTSTDGAHSHTPASNPANTWATSDNGGLFLDGVSGAAEITDADGMSVEGDHNHTFVTSSETVSVTNSNAATGISMASAVTGATAASNTTGITVASFGSGDAHNNMPPYVAVLYVQRIG